MVGAIVDEAKLERERWAQWFDSARTGNVAGLEQLLRSRPPEDWKGHKYAWVTLTSPDDERTAFLIAAESGHLATMQLLVSRGARARAEVDGASRQEEEGGRWEVGSRK